MGKQEQNSFFYQKFVNEENIDRINNIVIQRKYWTYSFSMILFSLLSGTFPTFVGYNFTHPFAISMLVIELLMLFFLLYFSIRFVSLDKKYQVFKKDYYPILFSLGYILLSVVFAIVAHFTTTFISYPDGSFSVSLNPVFYLFVFLPVFLIYALFCYYAFMKCFAKYTKRGSDIHKDLH